jgi:hypothetical protein
MHHLSLEIQHQPLMAAIALASLAVLAVVTVALAMQPDRRRARAQWRRPRPAQVHRIRRAGAELRRVERDHRSTTPWRTPERVEVDRRMARAMTEWQDARAASTLSELSAATRPTRGRR